ncbi:carboxylesterase/lipase family protein [Microbulbifer hainanensis]|uniref:carboxylesterase/lipase family protein n=1 Tax=Microbulbifer hainanensis TaxID=2735675 RepID=UPI00186737CA|nr:carboxylesterase family protein [Microbulbifer hainanensis]
MTSDANIPQNIDDTAARQTEMIATPAGPLLGKIDPKTGVQCFLGVPFAAPPVGELRWRAPQKMAPWRAPLQATRFGMPAAQNPSLLFKVLGPNGEHPEGEDCLYLNIYAPPQDRRSSTKLPVMVWIHGGSFYLGSGSQEIYDGRYLAASGRAIVVTFNYRLGALGFLRLDDISDIPATGNEGLQDQIAALQWVQENVAAFGGDPDNVTLFGESAGAMCIVNLMAARNCRGLFHRAIVQSGNPSTVHSRDRANDLGRGFLEHLAQLRDVDDPAGASTREILQAQLAVLSDPRMEQHWGQLPFKPVIDGALLHAEPVTAMQDGSAADLSLLLGYNLDEWNLFSATAPDSFTLDSDQIRARLEWMLPGNVLDPLLEHYYRKAVTLTGNPWPEWSRAWNLMLTDMIFTLPGMRLLQAHGGRNFHYHFAQPLASQPLLGACHAVELGYVFGTHGESAVQDLYGAETEPHQLSDVMRDAWLNFAESGDPGKDWPAFSEGHSRRFGDHPEDRAFDAAEVAALWQHVPHEWLQRYL